MMRRTVLVLSLVAALSAAAACNDKNSQGNQVVIPPVATAPPPAVAQQGGLLVPRDQRLMLRNMTDGKEYVLGRAPANTFYTHPRWSPDGTQIAYVLNRQYSGVPNEPWGGEIGVSAPDGSNPRTVFKPQSSGTTIEGLAWMPDGRGFYAGILETQIQDGRFIGQTLRLQQIDLATGGTRTVAREGVAPTVSPDGSSIGYITYAAGEDPGGLWVSRPDGSERRLLVPASGRFLAVASPRFSPDGKTLAFAATSSPGGGLPSEGGRTALRLPWRVPVAAAHGWPMDIWTVPAAGGEPRRVTSFLEDEPYPAWSPDGAQLAILASGGLYQIALTGGDPRKIGLGGNQAQIDWR